MPYDQEGAAIARMYDADYRVFRNPSGDVAFYVEEAKASGGPVAEFGCGTGRVLVPTAEAGVEIAGVDSSEAMLAQARAKLEGLPATVHAGDMRDFSLGREFALVTIPFRAIAHLETTEDQLAAFDNMRRHVAADGRLVFDFFQFDPRYLATSGEERLEIEHEHDGKTIRRYGTSSPHLSRQVSDIRFRWEIEDADGNVERLESSFTMRWIHRYETEHLLARCGLKIESIYGDFGRGPFDDDSKEMIFTASRS